MSCRLRVIDRPTEVSYWDLAKLPPGSMWREPEKDLPERECYCIVLPGLSGLWRTTETSNLDQLWEVSGSAPDLTVTPSLNAEIRYSDGRVEGWHGFITNGEMTP